MSNLIQDIIDNDVKKTIDITGLSSDKLLELYNSMLLIEKVENKVADLVRENIVKCPCHLGAGQEAIAVGVCDNLTNKDYVFGTHRAHAHFFAMGGQLNVFFAEVMGKKTGCSKGIGGSMHLIDKKNGFWGSVPIVGATIPIAAGAALAIKRKREDAVAVCFFGDGATEEGAFQESLNMAASMELPVLFVCENNFYSSHLDIKYRQPDQRTARFAEANYVKSITVDGNNIIAVKQESERMIDYIKQTGKPAFIEFTTYRFYGHVGPNKDIDVGVRRSVDDMNYWSKLGPITRLKDALLNSGVHESQFTKIEEKIDLDIQLAVQVAESDPYPNASELMNNVYVSQNQWSR